MAILPAEDEIPPEAAPEEDLAEVAKDNEKGEPQTDEETSQRRESRFSDCILMGSQQIRQLPDPQHSPDTANPPSCEGDNVDKWRVLY